MPPPPKAGPTAADVQPGDRLPQGPILYHVVRDSVGTTMIPVGEVVDQELRPIEVGDDPGTFGERFSAAFLREEAEFTLFHNGRRAGTFVVDSAAVPDRACRPLPRATGTVELTGDAAQAGEFLAMARTQAPQGRMIPGGDLEPERRMQVVGNILAERTLRARDAALPNWSRARRQLQPFPVSETRDLGFTATFLVDDELAIGHDDDGYSLFIVYTPQAQTGYDTAYVDFTSYTAEGKAAPRTIDFLDWDRDGQVELLLEVFGTAQSWYAAVGPTDEEWRQIFDDRCDPGTAAPPATGADTVPTDTADSAAARAPGSQSRARPGRAPPDNTPTPLQASPLVDPLADIQPRIQLSDPTATRRRPARRDTHPDTSNARRS